MSWHATIAAAVLTFAVGAWPAYETAATEQRALRCGAFFNATAIKARTHSSIFEGNEVWAGVLNKVAPFNQYYLEVGLALGIAYPQGVSRSALEEDRQVGMRAFNRAFKQLQFASLEVIGFIEALGGAPGKDVLSGSPIESDLERCAQFEPPNPSDIYTFHEFSARN